MCYGKVRQSEQGTIVSIPGLLFYLVTKIAAVKICFGISQPLLRAVSIVNTNRTIPVVYGVFVSGNEYRYSPPNARIFGRRKRIILPRLTSLLIGHFLCVPGNASVFSFLSVRSCMTVYISELQRRAYQDGTQTNMIKR